MFGSRSKFLWRLGLENLNLDISNFPQRNRAAVGGSLESYILARNFQSRSKSRIFLIFGPSGYRMENRFARHKNPGRMGDGKWPRPDSGQQKRKWKNWPKKNFGVHLSISVAIRAFGAIFRGDPFCQGVLLRGNRAGSPFGNPSAAPVDNARDFFPV